MPWNETGVVESRVKIVICWLVGDVYRIRAGCVGNDQRQSTKGFDDPEGKERPRCSTNRDDHTVVQIG